MATFLDDLTSNLREVIAMRLADGETHDEILATRGDLEAKIETSADETRRFMKILYEDILSRIALLGEGRTSPPS